MKIGREEVVHVAQLSRLTLTEPELARMQQDLTEIPGLCSEVAAALSAIQAKGMRAAIEELMNA